MLIQIYVFAKHLKLVKIWVPLAFFLTVLTHQNVMQCFCLKCPFEIQTMHSIVQAMLPDTILLTAF